MRAAGARVRGLLAAAAALALFVSLAFAAVTLTSGPSKPVLPVQMTGTAAGLPHRVSAAADVGRIVDGHFVSSAAVGRRFQGPKSTATGKEVPGAVAPYTRPAPLKFPDRGKSAPEKVSVLRAPAPAPVAGYNAKTSRELAPADASQVVYSNPGGTKTAFQYESAVNYRRPDATWAAISTSLVPVEGAGAAAPVGSTDAWIETHPTAPAATPNSPSPTAPPSLPTPSVSASSAMASPSVSPSVPASPSSPDASPSASPSSAAPPAAPAGGWTEQAEAEAESFAADADARDLVSFPVGGGHTVSFGIAGAAAVQGTASGSTVDYAGVRPDATVSFTAGTGLVKEDIVLSSPVAPATWVFPLDLTGLHAQLGAGGNVEFADAAGKVLAYVPHGFMTDSDINPHSGNGATSSGVTYSLVTVGGRQAIRMTLDTAWLDSKARVYPVTVDPPLTDGTDGTTYTLTPFDNDYSGDDEIDVGTYDAGTNVAESYLDFSSVASDLTNDTVLGVRLGLFNTWSYSCEPRPVYVYPITSPWSVTGDKTTGPSTGGAVGRKSFATGWTPEGSTSSPCPHSWEGIDLDQAATDLVNGWTHGTEPDYGLAVGASGKDSRGWKKFSSDENPDGTPGNPANPVLAVTYTTDGASYALASKRPVTVVTPTQNGSFKITVTNTGSSTWTPTNGYEMSYVAYNGNPGQSDGTVAASHPVFTPMPTTVAPGGSATVNVAVNKLNPGIYRIVFGMYSGATGSSPQSFASQGIQDFEIGLSIPEPPPPVLDVYPPNGFVSSTLQQQLSTTASGTGTLTYDFTMTCDPVSGQTCVDSTVSSGTITKSYWTPPAADLQWNTKYGWSVKVTATSGGSSSSNTISGMTMIAEVPQPAVTSDLGSSSDQDYDPLTGNYTTSATDASVAAVGPALAIDRTYNSLDPRSSGAFGAGWSSVVDTSLRNDGSSVVVTMPDGRQLRFGENGDSTYAPPFGNPDALVRNSSGTWTLRDSSGSQYTFTSAGLLSSITDDHGNAQDFTDNSSGEPTTITDRVSGRTLTLAWAKQSGAAYPHVTSVATQAPSAGVSAYAWAYTYSGDELTKVCAPVTSGTVCTPYSYGGGSHYWSSVLDAGPRSYWQLGEAAGSATAADEVNANLGTTDGTYENVALGQGGPLAGSSETGAGFNGTSSYVSLPNDLISDSTDVSIGLWFKAAKTSTGGVLFSYDADPVTNSSGGSTNRQPALYIGTNGELYGEFYNGTTNPIHTTTSVEDDGWHYAVLTASSSSQSLYLDGAAVTGSPLSGQIDQLNNDVDTIGAGFWNGWPEDTSTALSYFDGDIGQVAVYPEPLSAATIASQYSLATAASPEMTQVTLPSGKVYEQATYDTATARLASYTDPDGGRWKIGGPLATGYRPTADSTGYVTDYVTVTDPAGRQETYGYDMLNGGRLVSYDNGADPPETYGYDAAGFLTLVIDQDSNMLCLTNDVHGNVLTRTWYPVEPSAFPGTGPGAAPPDCGGSTSSSPNCPSTGAPCTTFYGYTTYDTANPLDPDNDKLTSVRDGRSASATDDTYDTTYSYNAAGQLQKETTPATSDFPDGRTTTYTYSNGTQPAANGGTVPTGLLLSAETPGGKDTSYSYNSNGDLAKLTEPSGRYTTYTYDTLGRPESSTVYTSTFASGETTNYAYTPTGQPSTITYPAIANQVTNATHQLEDTYTYNDDNDLMSLTEADLTGGDPSRTTSYTYNDHDEAATVTQPAGATNGGTSQPQGAASADPDGATTGYDYDAFGNITQVTDPNGNQYRYAYNEYQEPTQETLYTPSTNASQAVADCAAPATQDPDGGCDLVLESYEYDPAGLPAAVTDAMGRITNFDYDSDQELLEASTTEPCTASGPCTSLGSCTPTAQCTSGSVGIMTNYAYDGAGNVVSKSVAGTGYAAGQSTNTDYTYDAADRLDSVVADAPPPGDQGESGYANRTTAYTYNADNQVLSQTLGSGTGTSLAVTSYGYDPAGDMTSQTVDNDATDDETTWTYDQNGLPLSMTLPAGNLPGADAANYTTKYTYDPAGDLVTETGAPISTQSYASQTPVAARPVTTYGYDTFGDQTQYEDPDGNTTTAAYDGDGRVTSLTPPSYLPPGSTSAITTPTRYAYDEDGNLQSETDAETNVTTYGYDALGDLTSVTEPPLPGQSAPVTWTYGYDADGEVLSAKDPLGNMAHQTYDYFGNVATSTDPLQNTAQYAYDYLGDQTTADSPDGTVTTSTYDDLGELTSTADAYGDTTSFDYDDQGHPQDVYYPDGSFENYGYDQAGELTSVSDWGPAPPMEASPELRSESFGYDADGNQTSATDWDGHTTAYSYNAAGELTSEVKPVSSSSSITTSYGYDPAGNPTSVTDGNTNTTWTTFNAWNLPESVIEPATPAAPDAADRTWTTAYNADRLPATASEPGGISLSYGYDPLGDLTSESGTGASAATEARSFAYDLDGQLTSASTAAGADSLTYYANGNLKTTTGPSGASSYDYNGDGLVSSETDAAGTTSYTYDQADRLATEDDPLTGTTLTWAYNPDSNPSSVTYATGNSAGPQQSFGYDGLQRLTADTLTSPSGATLASESYGYDPDGNVTSQATGGQLPAMSATYGYDQDSRLTSATSGGTTTAYGYDNAGNLTQDGGTTSTYNPQDQLNTSTDSAGTTAYGYSLSGTLSSVTPPGAQAGSL